MTIVIAQKRREEVIFLADTKIGEPAKRADDEIPGRLKIVTLAPCLTAAFAGKADAAHVRIKAARGAWRKGGISAAVGELRMASLGGEIDFLIALHTPEAMLIEVHDGAVRKIDTIAAIGHPEIFQNMGREFEDEDPSIPLSQGVLRNGFMKLMLPPSTLPSTIGGIPTAALACPSGHRYLKLSAFCTAELEMEWGRETHQSEYQVYSGSGGHLQYHFDAFAGSRYCCTRFANAPGVLRIYIFAACAT